jgi:putative endonuclease
MHNDALQLLFELSRQAQSRSLRKRRVRQKANLKAAERQACPQSELPRLSPTQRQGADYESRALDLLTQAGLQLLARNLRTRTGEIDLVMRDRRTLVFVEVRARQAPHFGCAAASVGRLKQSRLVRAAACLLPTLTQRYWQGQEPPVRFDVVTFDSNTPQWLRHAFTR